ncbi:MAG: nuclear transport factor 2 family protein [Desulfobacterales bacterium]|jgi:ketosteroid isomerase-like protein
MSAIRYKDFENWLIKYGNAWENGDLDAMPVLFTSDARFYETPFDDPMKSLDEIYKYWKDNAVFGRKEVHFSHEVLAVYKNVDLAHWRANFIRLHSGHRVKLDGILKTEFSDDGKCQIFREWWHHLEETASE